jgi:hypothetical protein
MPVERPKQQLADEIVADLMRTIRNQFYPDLTDKEWFKDHYHFTKKNVVLWPARFIYGKGFTMTGERYKAILMGIFDTIKAHGNTGRVRHWQFYLMKCIQEHFKHHWEDYYAEAKSARSLAEHALLGLRRATAATVAPDPIEAMALAQRLAAPGRRVRRKTETPKQGKLL